MNDDLTDIEERALHAFGMKIEEGVPWEHVERLSGMSADDILLHADKAMKKLGEPE